MSGEHIMDDFKSYRGVLVNPSGQELIEVSDFGFRELDYGLRHCPFCGHDPVSHDRKVLYLIECNHADCPVQPHVSAATKGQAEKKWNSRTDGAQWTTVIPNETGLYWMKHKLSDPDKEAYVVRVLTQESRDGGEYLAVWYHCLDPFPLSQCVELNPSCWKKIDRPTTPFEGRNEK